MKTKFIAAACMALGASTSFAALLACDTTSPVSMVNTCPPDVKLFIVGSSSLGDALSTVVPADLFDTSIVALIKIKNTSGDNQATYTTAWYGMSKAAVTYGTSKRLYVVYNNNNGSGAGVSQMLAKLGKVAEADVLTIGPTKAVPNTCIADGSSTFSAPVVDCTSHAPTQADLAISDVHPSELYKLYTAAAGNLNSLTIRDLSLQGFGVAVNANLYSALQTQNLADHLIPSDCVAGDLTAHCQPTIRSADYASLVTKQGSIKTAAALLNNPSDTTVLTLARRDDLSGTQAASNIFFADNACGNNVVKGKLVEGVLGGELNIISTTDSTAALVVQANATSGEVKQVLNGSYGSHNDVYAIGVLSLTTAPGSSGTWRFVKIDGVSPNFNADGTAAYKQRTAFTTGNYPFAMTSFAAYPTNAPKTGVATLFPAVIPTVIAGLNDSTLHDLTGIGYLDGVADVPGTPKQSLVHRKLVYPNQGNNCSPLIK